MEKNEATMSIAKQVEMLNELIAKCDKAKADGKGYYSYCLPGVINEDVRKYGADKVFFVSESYHGMYEDDYCSFIYWNEATKEYVSDNWTTAAACPSFDLYEAPIKFKEAWDAGLIDKVAFLAMLRDKAIDRIDKFGKDEFGRYKLDDKKGLRVKVEGGAKWKGTGILLGHTESSYRFAPSYGRGRDFGVNTTITAKVLDNETNEICDCNAKYLEFIDQNEIEESYVSWAKKLINGASLMNNGEDASLDCDTDFAKFMEIWKSAHSTENEVCNKAIEEYKSKKIEEIIEWVKEKTDKKGGDIIALAEHIFNKRHAWS